MEILLRLLLVCLGVIIFAALIWDSKKNKKLLVPAIKKATTFSEPILVKNEEEFIIIYVMAKHEWFSGREILEAFQDLYLYYGERQIFYRYENIDGTGEELFWVVSAVEPGYFEISKMEDFSTPGITLFFKLTQPNRAIAAFEVMLRTARQLALKLGGELMDKEHQLLAFSTIDRYRQRIRSSFPDEIRPGQLSN